MTEQEKKAHLVETLNKLFAIKPININDFNLRFIYLDDDETKLTELEKFEDKVGLFSFNGYVGISILSIIATITDLLVDDRLAFSYGDDGIILGVSWIRENK